ncbi:hypothetical protein [Flavobacterium sp. SORGH_AS_0622]|uniref:hypothetical protein n=1 Tax=Flavobacterium sp. SORGH_AS_0622 TaxID=3041772 RepID=UPI0027808D31|nr:hypothetical protein [Flavobacterium sp. SORGH_AS_0622]MDQ1164880.1 hypothetical protein [Flavobacterium sp. SORGH_AS_0622]
MEKEKNSTNEAIDVCNDKISTHRLQASKFLAIIIILSTLFIASEAAKIYYETAQSKYLTDLYSKYYFTNEKLKDIYGYKNEKMRTKQDTLDEIKKMAYLKLDQTNESIKELKEKIELSKKGFDSYIIYGIFILIFSIVTSFYRFHQKEISKHEHYLIGFHRIRIAANNSKNKFETEVRTELTRDAFSYETHKAIFSKEKKIESPIPGHPTSDISVMLINKIFEAIEIKAKKS